MSKRVTLDAGHRDVVFQFTKHELHVYTSCCGAPVSRRKAEHLRKALTKWLARSP